MIFKNKDTNQPAKPKSKKLSIIIVLILLTLIIGYYLNNFGYINKIISYVNHAPLPNNDNSFPRGNILVESEDQKSLWKTIESKYGYDSTNFPWFNNDIGVIRTSQSTFLIRLDGLNINVAFNSEDNKLEFKNLVKQELFKLGYQEINPTKKLYDITFINSSLIEAVLYKDNQVFLIEKDTPITCQKYSFAKDGYCPISIYYINDIKRHVDKGTQLLDKISIDNQGLFNLQNNNSVTDGVYLSEGIEVDNYIILVFRSPTNKYAALLKKQGLKLQQIWFGDNINGIKEVIKTDPVSDYVKCVYNGYLTGLHVMCRR